MHSKTPRTRLARQTPKCTSGAAVEIGSLVTVVALKTGERKKFKVVSTTQSGVRHDEVSSWAPLGKALLGRRVGESVYVEAPSGTVRYQILKIGKEV